MELTSDLTGIQSIMNECDRQYGELAKMKYRGGNERSIAAIVDKLKQYLISKSYIVDPFDANQINNEQLEKIILFLVLNTKLNEETALTNIKEYSHLINIMPKLSKLLLIDLMIENNLIEVFMRVVYKLPLDVVVELFESANDMFVGVEGKKTLKNVSAIVRCLIEKVNASNIQDNKVSDNVRKINNIIGQLLMNLSVHPSASMPMAPESEQSLHIGYTLYALLKMLLMVNEESMACGKIIDALVLTSSIVVKHVTLNIYCEWTEVNEVDMPLQYAVGTEAYHVIEKYMKIKPAAELISLLTCMAKKPKSLSEIINSATLLTIVNKVNEADANQRRWFGALLSKDIFDHTISRQCLEKWSSLCTVDDVLHLLKLALEKDENAKRLAIKCAAHLPITDTSILIARFFWMHEPWKPYVLGNNIQQSVTLLLNQNRGNSNKEFIKEMQLLLLESPLELVEVLFKESLKNPVFVELLEPVFKAIRNVMNLNTTPLNLLKDILLESDLLDSEDGWRNIVCLLDMLIHSESTEVNNIFAHVLQPLLMVYQGDLMKLDHVLAVTKSLDNSSLMDTYKEELILRSLQYLDTHRIKYTEFSQHRISICVSCIDIITKLSSSFEDLPGINLNSNQSKLNSYYLSWTSSQSSPRLLSFLFPEFEPESYGQMLSNLIKILSRCVPQEWLQIAEELATSLGTQKAVEAITDSLVLICEVTKTQDPENVSVYSALTYYLNNYGICLQKMREKDASLQCETIIVKNICRLLKVIPKDIKYREGVNLITLFSEEALKTLAKDSHFVCTLPGIEDTNLTQIIAKKMIN